MFINMQMQMYLQLINVSESIINKNTIYSKMEDAADGAAGGADWDETGTDDAGDSGYCWGRPGATIFLLLLLQEQQQLRHLVVYKSYIWISF